MKAVVLAGPGDLQVRDVPDPILATPADAIVRVTTTALCGADLFPFHGHVPGFVNGTVLGHEFVGIVESVGAAVSTVRSVTGWSRPAPSPAVRAPIAAQVAVAVPRPCAVRLFRGLPAAPWRPGGAGPGAHGGPLPQGPAGVGL